MPVNDELGKRMKEYYEGIPKTRLMRRCPVALRLDGKAFHTFTRGFKRPFDEVLIKTMQETAKYLCENIQGTVMAYTQSDEITLILVDYRKLNSSAWFDYEVQKMCSVAASMATLEFNRQFIKAIRDWWNKPYAPMDDVNKPLYDAYLKAIELGAMFDARVFSIPEEEVANAFIWRQQHATRNAIQMLGQTHFSHKQLEGRSCNDIQDMLFLEKNINFNDMPIEFKRGVCCYRKEVPCIDGRIEYKKEWILDKECPIFSQDRNYIEQHIQRKDS